MKSPYPEPLPRVKDLSTPEQPCQFGSVNQGTWIVVAGQIVQLVAPAYILASDDQWAIIEKYEKIEAEKRAEACKLKDA